MTDKNKLVITRIFDAPRKLVWKMWTDPEMFKKWWGPKVFTCPVSKIDFKVGGKYLHCMQDAAGNRFWSTGIYKEIVPLRKIVSTDSFADETGNVVPASHYGIEGFPIELEVTIEFEERDGTTKMTLTHAGIGNADEKMRKDMDHGWNESFDKLVERLKK